MKKILLTALALLVSANCFAGLGVSAKETVAYRFFNYSEENDCIALFDEKGNQLSDYKYSLDEGLGEVYIDDYEYHENHGAVEFSEGLAVVHNYNSEEFGTYSFIDINGNEVSTSEYDFAMNFCEGLAWVSKEGKCGYIDTSMKEAIPFIYDGGSSFSEGLAGVCKDEKWGYIDKSGKEVIPCIYEIANDFSEGLASVYKDGKWGYIDKSGNVVIPFIYDFARPFFDGLALVEKSFNDTFIDKLGNEPFSCEYDSCWSFSEGLARVEKDGKYGFIDNSGKEIIPCIYDDTGIFSGGVIHVEKNGKVAYLNKNGKELTSFTDGFLNFFPYGHAEIEQDGKWGLIDEFGKEILPCIYESVSSYSEDIIVAEKDGKKIYMDPNGNEIFSFDVGTYSPCYFQKIVDTVLSVNLNGSEINFSDQQPVIVEGRTLVPLRAIFEALGATVDWNNDTRTVTSVKDGKTVSLTIGSNILYCDGEEVVLDVPAQIKNGRTLVPVRAISESFGVKVDWDGDTRTVILEN